MTGRIFAIERTSFVDGPGIRTTVFFQGCDLRCVWCHNPESQSASPRVLYYANRCANCGHCETLCPAIGPDRFSDPKTCVLCGRCVSECPASARVISGREASVEEIMAEILADRIYYRDTGGATFSGGECMLQPDFLTALLSACRREGIRTAVDTAGDVPWERFLAVEPLTDLFLYDVKAFSPELHRRLTGADNARILRNYVLLHGLSPQKLIVRIPVVPEANTKELDRIASFLAEYPPKELELLKYHAMGGSKAEALGRKAQDFPVPAKEEMDSWKTLFREKGIRVK